MMKRNLLNSLILTALAIPGVAMAADVETTEHKEGKHVIPESAHTITSNIGLVSNYLYRGISQTGGNPALQGGFDYAHSSGIYAGIWGSNVSWIGDSLVTSGSAIGATSSSLELDTYFGYKSSFATDFSYDVGYLRYNYPGEYPSTMVAGAAKADTDEIYGAIGYKWVTLKYSHSLGDTFGLDDANGTSYVELNASYSLAEAGVTLGAHYGKQTYKGTAADALKATYIAGISQDATYSDYKLSASKDFSGYVVGLAYSKTNADAGGFYTATRLDGSTVDLGKGTAVLSLAHSF